MVLMALRAARPDVDFGVGTHFSERRAPAKSASRPPTSATVSVPARAALAHELPMQGWRLGCIRQGRHAAAGSKTSPLPTTTRSSIPRAATSPAACSNCSARSDSRATTSASVAPSNSSSRTQDSGRLMVRPLGRQLRVRHLADFTRPALHRRRHAPAVDHPRPRLAGELPERGRRLGRDLHQLRRPDH